MKLILLLMFSFLLPDCTSHSNISKEKDEHGSSESLPVNSPHQKPDVFWEEKLNDIKLTWRREDLYITFGGKIHPVFSKFAKYKFAEVRERSPKAENEHSFKLLSVVGKFISFEHEMTVFEAVPFVERRYTTVDLTKAGDFRYFEELNSENPVFTVKSGTKIIALYEFFREEDILLGLKKEPTIKKAIEDTQKTENSIKNLPELYNFIKTNQVTWENDEFEISPDFLTRFAFYSVNEDIIEVRIALNPIHSYNRMNKKEIAIFLPINEKLKDELKRADNRQFGFLMKDVNKMFGNQNTVFEFQ